MARTPALRGSVTVRFVIHRDGTVSNASAVDSTFPDRQVAECVRSKFLEMRFPCPEGGIVTVSYPLMFAPG